MSGLRLGAWGWRGGCVWVDFILKSNNVVNAVFYFLLAAGPSFSFSFRGSYVEATIASIINFL